MTQPRSLRRPFFLDRDLHELHRITTPDGVPLPFVIAPVGSRLTAFLLDTLILVAGVLALLLFMGIMGMGARFAAAWALPVAILASFLGWNFYFTWFELRWQGSTPGKRKMGLRVIDAHGGQLSGNRSSSEPHPRYRALHPADRPDPAGADGNGRIGLAGSSWRRCGW